MARHVGPRHLMGMQRREYSDRAAISKRAKFSWAAVLMLMTPALVLLQPAVEAQASPTDAEVGIVAAAVDSANGLLERLGISDNAALAVTYQPDTLIIRTSASIPSALLSGLATAAPKVAISISKPAFSVRELNAEAARLASVPGISWAGPNDDYSGLVVGVLSGQENLGAISTYPLAIQTAPEILPAARNNDTRPVNGGSLIHPPNSTCSAGIGVSYNNGANFGFTTAEHCANGTYTGGTGAVIGSSSGAPASAAKDVRIVAAPSTTSLVWIGAYNSSSSRQTYRAASPPANGQAICTDGAISGERCGSHYVRGINMYANVSGVSRGPGFWTLNETVSGGAQVCAAQPGDSGSPVYNYISDGRLEVRGLLSAIDPSYSTTSCAGSNPNYPPGAPPNAPSSRAFAINVNAALSALGATPRLG